MNYNLNNVYRDDYHDQKDDPSLWVPVIDTHDVHDSYAVTDNGHQRAGVVVDANPHILGLGVQLDNDRTMTAVIPRELITMIELDFASELPLRSSIPIARSGVRDRALSLEPVKVEPSRSTMPVYPAR